MEPEAIFELHVPLTVSKTGTVPIEAKSNLQSPVEAVTRVAM